MLQISDTLFSLMVADAYSAICFRQLLQQCPALNMKRMSEHPHTHLQHTLKPFLLAQNISFDLFF